MARLTPIDYQMQVMNPMAAALQGYQAGFGQMQQLDQVRRQREADEMAKQRFEAEMAQTQAATARAQEVQSALGDIWGRMADGENVTVQDLQRVQSRFPEVAEQLQSLTENLTAQERSAKFFDTVELVSLAQNPDLYRDELNRRIDASESNPEQQRALQAQLQAYDAAEQAQEGGGAAYARTVGGMAAMQLADNEQQLDLVSKTFFPEPEAPLSPIGKLAADLQKGLITQEQFNAEVASRQRAEPGLQIRTDSEGNIQVSYGSDVLPFETQPEQPKGKGSTPVRIPGRPEIRISPGQQQQAATKEFNTLAAFVAKNDIVRDEVEQALALIEAGAGSSALMRLGRSRSDVFREMTEGGPLAALEGHIKTIKAQIGFGELQDMRNNSPTGGAVGSLSAQEFDNLASMLGDLNVARPELLETQLNRIVDYVTDMEVRAEQALNANYADIITVVTQQGEVERQTEQALRLTYDQNTGDVY